jgi:hypothetical protein
LAKTPNVQPKDSLSTTTTTTNQRASFPQLCVIKLLFQPFVHNFTREKGDELWSTQKSGGGARR